MNALGITGSVIFSGLIGALIGGLLAGRYLVWQTRETARHQLRSIIIGMCVHVQQCKGVGGNRTEPWTVYMKHAIAAYQRYRALLLPWQRPTLDAAWTSFQGTDPNGSTPYAYAPMMEFESCLSRVRNILHVLKCFGHANGIGSDCDRCIHQDGVGAHFHRRSDGV